MAAFALTIFTGAFLLFQVQPLIGKYILPWFGGGPGVWTTCMLFFQVVLLAGYAYAHALSRYFRPRTQVIVHLALVTAALLSLPIIPGEGWKPQPGGSPVGQILSLLAANIGLPYLILSATGPLMQEWFRRTSPGAAPYRLYALSNIGSLLALVSYPFYFETNFTRIAQARFWSWGLAAYAVVCAACAVRVWRTGEPEGPSAVGPAPGAGERNGPETQARSEPVRQAQGGREPHHLSGMRRLSWVALPACASVLLLAVTNKICQDIAVIPFLWVLPLGLYLLTFIISFDSPRWYSRTWFSLLVVAAVGLTVYALYQDTELSIVRQVVIFSGTLFVGGMICHGELYRLKPDPRHLTSYYLMIAAGGALGGLFVALVAPAIFNNFFEIHLALAGLVALLVVILWRDDDAVVGRRLPMLAVVLALAAIYGTDQAIDRVHTWLAPADAAGEVVVQSGWSATRHFGVHWPVWAVTGAGLIAFASVQRRRVGAVAWRTVAVGSLGVGLIALVVLLGLQIREVARNAIVSSRNFYGVLAVHEYGRESFEDHYYMLQHGRITHGIQFADRERARTITSYFGPLSGLGLALRQFPRQENQRIGLLGLGVGTIAAYGKPGDYLRIYEIDPAVRRIAAKPFSYLATSRAKVEVVMGDGRLSMEREPAQNLDFLIMDAFTSDAVPVHLLTKEAFEIYQRHLKPDGVILVNISNRYLNLRPVVENAARAFGFMCHAIDCEDGVGDDAGDNAWWLYGSSWMVLSKNKEFMSRPALTAAASAPAKPNDIPLWTDDYSSMFRVLQ